MYLKIILLGYMGSGKTYIGKALSKVTKIPFYDLDKLIIKNTGYTINNIFNKQGENQFRLLENKILKNFLKQNIHKYILSVGGGTPCYYNNILLMNKYAFTIYLQTNIKMIFNRLKNEKINRPIIKNMTNNELYNFINYHLNKRDFFYLKAKQHLIINKKNIHNIIQDIYLLLK